MYQKISKELNKLKNPVKAKVLQGFFKTNKGEYGEGDIFLGISVPAQRKIVKKYFSSKGGPVTDWKIDIQKLLNSKNHEYKMTGVLILVEKYKQGNNEQKKEIFNFYFKNTNNINNWDLVDLSAPSIIGNYLLNKDKKILYKLAKSKNFWERRISIVATLTFIRAKQFKEAIKISELLLKDSEDLIHKAVGWMLREVGKRDETDLIKFLNKYVLQMPRIMLRYSIERLSEKKRKYYLNKK